jgi:hypothetical protein
MEGFFLGLAMWKIILGFAVFAAVALFLLSKAGDIDMTGEKHGANTADTATPPAPVAQTFRTTVLAG